MPYLWLHSPGVGWAGITNGANVSDRDVPGLTILREVTRHFRPVLSAPCAAVRAAQRGVPGIFWESKTTSLVGLRQISASSEALRAKVGACSAYTQNVSLRGPTNESSFDELRRYASEVEAAPHFFRLYTIYVSHV